MMDWFITALVLTIGSLIMITGLIEYVFIGFMAYLLIMVVLSIIARIWLYFRKRNDK
ncbi:hypothetical protein [Raoultella ornithinolytica]|uniref:Uncharacterized protein n=1 Tax=Raoultella ornithinolytica TaxID=54291 RepID=A0A9Q9JCG5_RAOOR|nr:hypothetical protein [Raoultella ornithinolytica]HDT5885595.1 hypothetical protein [Klebsiella pneumoniae subsp. pneumoniae]HDX8798793.1 hypothetical protein [Klebsiella michiganensis]UXE36465.1 hypothetical protein N2J37_18110 [Raoultella ornithinolytica]HDT5929631.1 hypothetical protein [Klebsiella pneumoniae subsp. pneumoniae]HDT6023210.1 hypothetical protein [Klebsiella pneumoniae subsp. pneumoniae]